MGTMAKVQKPLSLNCAPPPPQKFHDLIFSDIITVSA